MWLRLEKRKVLIQYCLGLPSTTASVTHTPTATGNWNVLSSSIKIYCFKKSIPLLIVYLFQ